MNACVLRLDHRRLDSEDLLDPFSREYFSGRPVRDNASATEHQDLIGKPRSEIEIVHHAYGNHIAGICKTPYPLHEIDLVTDVEKRQRLIEKKVTARINGIVAPQLSQHTREVY